jgi:hypothetical protein
MKISKIVFIILLETVQRVAGWNHALAAEFHSILEKNDMTLVACEIVQHLSASDSYVGLC